MALASVYIKLHEGSRGSKKIIMARSGMFGTTFADERNERLSAKQEKSYLRSAENFYLFSLSITL